MTTVVNNYWDFINTTNNVESKVIATLWKQYVTTGKINISKAKKEFGELSEEDFKDVVNSMFREALIQMQWYYGEDYYWDAHLSK